MSDATHRNAPKAVAAPAREDGGQNSPELALNALERAILRLYESFTRWQVEAMAAACGQTMTGQEVALLNLIAQQGRAKTIRDLLHLTNRQDIPNVQYGLRKLLGLGFIQKEGSGRVGVYYSTTAAGERVCQDYAQLRHAHVLGPLTTLDDFVAKAEHACTQLEHIEKIYETATREAATLHRR